MAACRIAPDLDRAAAAHEAMMAEFAAR